LTIISPVLDLTLSLPLEPFPSSWSIGQIHAIRSLAYAPHNELILGAGFDYDVSLPQLPLLPFVTPTQVYAWDPTTKTLQMKLIGHRHSVVGVSVVYNPLERAATVDEAGTVKIWNIDRSQGFRGQHLQSLSAQTQSQINVISFAPISSHGTVLSSMSLLPLPSPLCL
jgi:hypothetical protein